MIDFNRDFAELTEKQKGRCRLASRLDEWARRQDAYLIESRLSPLEIVGRGSIAANLHRIRCASWRNRSEDRDWNKVKVT